MNTVIQTIISLDFDKSDINKSALMAFFRDLCELHFSTLNLHNLILYCFGHPKFNALQNFIKSDKLISYMLIRIF